MRPAGGPVVEHLLHGGGDRLTVFAGIAIRGGEAWLWGTVKATHREPVGVQAFVASGALQVQIQHIGVQDPRRLHRTEMAESTGFLCPAPLRMCPVIPREELRGRSLDAVQRAGRPEHVHMRLVATICSRRIMQRPDIGVLRTKGGLEKVLRCGQLLATT